MSLRENEPTGEFETQPLRKRKHRFSPVLNITLTGGLVRERNRERLINRVPDQ